VLSQARDVQLDALADQLLDLLVGLGKGIRMGAGRMPM
jgi:hypothetical protein